MNRKHATAAILSALLLCSCESAYEVMRADLMQPTTFLPDHDLLREQKASFPFRLMWRDTETDWFKYAKFKFEPVDASQLSEASWWEKITQGNATKMKQDIPELSAYMRSSFARSLKAASNYQLHETDSIDERTAVVRLAIVQLVPTKAFFNAVGTTVGFFIPGASFANMANAGSIAMECKVFDGKTGKLILMLSDREKDETAIIDINSYTWYGHAKEIIDGWAKGFAELAVKKDPDRVKKDFPINIISI